MTDEELRALVAENSQGLAEVKQNLNSLITDVIRPLSETTIENSEIAREAAQRSARNAELFRILLAEMREDRMTNQKRYDEQMDIIRSMLARFTAMDRNEEDS